MLPRLGFRRRARRIHHARLEKRTGTRIARLALAADVQRAALQTFELSLRVRYNPQQVCYEPGFWQELKWGWVQFLAILLPIYIFIEWWRQFVFGNQGASNTCWTMG